MWSLSSRGGGGKPIKKKTFLRLPLTSFFSIVGFWSGSTLPGSSIMQFIIFRQLFCLYFILILLLLPFFDTLVFFLFLIYFFLLFLQLSGLGFYISLSNTYSFFSLLLHALSLFFSFFNISSSLFLSYWNISLALSVILSLKVLWIVSLSCTWFVQVIVYKSMHCHATGWLPEQRLP